MEKMLEFFKNKIVNNEKKLIEENDSIDKLNEEVNELKKKINDFIDEECDLEKSRIFNIEVFIYCIIVIIFTMTGMYMNIDKAGICLFSILNAIFVFGIGSKYLGDKEGIEKRVKKRLEKNYSYNYLNSKMLEKVNDIDFKKEYIIRLNDEITSANRMIEAIERIDNNNLNNDSIEKVNNKVKVRVKKKDEK